MWCETNARPSWARQKVFFSCAPQASTAGPPGGRGTGAGTYPRERRTGSSRPRKTRVTESSVRTWIGRSWVRKASAIAPRRAKASSSRWAIGSSETFPLVSTSGSAVSR